MAFLRDANPREWALDAARKDASYLISPRARASAIQILHGDHSSEADAARIILHDGGSQQGERSPIGDLPYLPATNLDTWREAANVLGVFDND